MIAQQIPFRLVHPDDTDESAGAGKSSERDWTIREAFQERVLPWLQRQGRASATIENYWRAINYWEQCRPDNPAINRITEEDLTRFPSQILSRGRVKTNGTANDHQMCVHRILQFCAQFLDHPLPPREKLPRQAATKFSRVVPDDVLDLSYRRCRVATLTKDPRLPAPLVWRSLLTLFVSLGLRRSEAILLPRSAWHREPEFPDLPEFPDYDFDASSPHGWLVFDTSKTRRVKGGRPLVLPVPKVLAEHLSAMDQIHSQRTRMFPLGECTQSWRQQWQRIQWGIKTTRGLAGWEPPFVPYTFQDLRKTANRRYRKLAGREVARAILGHQPRGVNETYYDELTEDAVDAVARIVFPAAFYQESGVRGQGTGESDQRLPAVSAPGS